MSLTLYANRLSQPCRAVEILLRELGIDFDWHEVDFANGQTHESWYVEGVHPFATIPVLDCGPVADHRMLAESHAIMRYLCRIAADSQAVADWYPGDQDPTRSARIDQWLDWHHGNIRRYDMFHHIMNLHLTLPMLKREIQATLLRPLQDQLRVGLATLEDHLWQHNSAATVAPLLDGGATPSIADLAIICELYQLSAVGYRFDHYPLVGRWMAGIARRPAFQQVSQALVEQGRAIKEYDGDYLALDQAFA